MKTSTQLNVFGCMLMLLIGVGCNVETKKNTYKLFVGTYTSLGSEGIYSYSFDADTGVLTDKTVAAVASNPSFLRFSPNNNYLYAVEETDTYADNAGAITTYQVQDEELQELHTVSTQGAHPCHIGVSEDGSQVAVSNYTGGSVALFNVNPSGVLIAEQLIDHKVLDSTQTSHAHAAVFSQGQLFVADLGLDLIQAYGLRDGKAELVNSKTLQLPKNAGPRHFTFSRNDEVLYSINELNSTIAVFKRDSLGNYLPMQTVTTLATDFTGDSFCADIHLSPDGNFLYGSNRGENTIVIFRVDTTTGMLGLVVREHVQGDWPRNFSLDPSGNWLLVANERSNSISVFKRNTTAGTLTFMQKTELSSPVCLVFLE